MTTERGDAAWKPIVYQDEFYSFASAADQLAYYAYERKVHDIMPALELWDNIGLDWPRYLRARAFPNSNRDEFFAIVDAAEAAGRIDRPQSRTLEQADIILSARDANDRRAYVVVKISPKASAVDLARVREQADLMAAASGAPAVAIIVSPSVPPPQRQKAAERGVYWVEEPLEDED